jgi:hypothetical protein
MRSIVLALAFLAPTAAFAATPAAAPADYTSPITTIHSTKPQEVLVTFRSTASGSRVLAVNEHQYPIRFGQVITVCAPVGSIVRVYSDQNSKISGQEVLRIAASDAQRFIPIS